MSLFLKEKRKTIIFVVAVFFHLILISLQVPLGEGSTYFEKAVFAVFSPLQRGTMSLYQKARGLWNNYFYLRDVQKQNQKMREEIFLLRQENNLLKSFVQKFSTEKEIKNNISVLFQSFIVGSVIGLDSSNMYKSLVINKGSRDGIQKQMVVLDRKGHLVGKVTGPISLKVARVQLITDEESGVSVFSQKKRILGVLKGDGRGRCVMKYVPSTAKDISEEEEVLTSGFDDVFPSGIKVGKIVSVTTDAALFKNIIVQPYFDFSDLEQVAILTVNLKEF